MKILIVIDSLGSGGAERSTEVLCDYLAEQKIIFQILALDKRDVGVQDRMMSKGYNITFIKKTGFLGEVRQIAQLIKKEKFNLVHSILFRANLRTRCAKIRTKFIHLESLVNTTYSRERNLDEKVNQPALKFFKFVDKVTANRGVDHFHSITETVKNHYVEQIGLDPSKITVIPRGRKPIISNFDERPEKHNEKVNFINVGRHEFQKGQIYLLEAANLLRDRGYDFTLNIYGREGTVTPELKEFIQKNELENIVFLKGYSNQVPKLLLEADVFAFSSLYEGLGGALIEAQAAGLPIACNDIPVLHEVVISDENAKFFDVHNISSIVEALEYFIDHPQKRLSYGKKSLQNYRNKFQESVNNQKLFNLYFHLGAQRN